MYLCNISWIIIIVVRETFTTQGLKCWEGNNSTTIQMWIYSVFTEYIHYKWGMTNVLYLLCIKTLSFIQTSTKVKVNSDIHKNYKSNHSRNSVLQHHGFTASIIIFHYLIYLIYFSLQKHYKPHFKGQHILTTCCFFLPFFSLAMALFGANIFFLNVNNIAFFEVSKYL